MKIKRPYQVVKFTKRQRLEAYNYALIRILDIKARRNEHNEDCYICYMLGEYYMKKTDSPGYAQKSMLTMFPELAAHKPENQDDNMAWFPWWDSASRIKLLNKIIEEI